MIFRPLFRKFFAITVLVFVSITAVSYFLSGLWEQFERERYFKAQASEIWSQVAAHDGDKLAYVNDLNALNEKMHSPIRVELRKASEPAPQISSPEPSTTQAIEIDHAPYNLTVRLRPRFHPVRGEGPPPGPPPFGPPPPFHGPSPFMGPRLVTFLSMLVSILLASALSMVLIFRSFRARAELAKDVLGRMQRGDLKARFPISHWDEASKLFELFNQMAGEIERLVESLRANEKKRVGLLQELAHDLRTPVSSLKAVIETIRFDEDALDTNTKEEIKEVALHETEYLSQLVEDLLFLALVLEPKYQVGSEDIALKELVEQQAFALQNLYPSIRCRFENFEFGTVTGSPHLLRRLIRNGLVNALSFARSEILVRAERDGDVWRILIRDDGPGLSPAALESFGQKKSGTRYDKSDRGRLSIGLGSVIMQTIAHAHGGHVSIRNIEGGRGAELTILIRASIPNASSAA